MKIETGLCRLEYVKDGSGIHFIPTVSDSLIFALLVTPALLVTGYPALVTGYLASVLVSN